MKGRVAGQLDADTLGTIDDPLETTDDGSAADLRQAEGEAEDSMPVVLLFFPPPRICRGVEEDCAGTCVSNHNSGKSQVAPGH